MFTDEDVVEQVGEEVVEIIDHIKKCAVYATTVVNLATSSNYAAFVSRKNHPEELIIPTTNKNSQKTARTIIINEMKIPTGPDNHRVLREIITANRTTMSTWQAQLLDRMNQLLLVLKTFPASCSSYCLQVKFYKDEHGKVSTGYIDSGETNKFVHSIQ